MSHRRCSTRRTNRPAALAGSAGALIALVAVAAMMTATMAGPGASTRDVRQTTNETAKVRAAVAAVAAAARTIVDGDRLVQALPAHWPAALEVAVPATARIVDADSTLEPPQHRLSERVLDLPPPAC